MALNVRSRLPIVVGLSWKKLGSDGEDTDESVCLTSPITRSKSRQSPETITEEVVMEENEHAEKEAMKENMFMRRLTRTRSVREAFGTLRQKFRVSTRRKKRLMDVKMSPYHPPTRTSTPNSGVRRSARIANQDEKLYSPFCIDTPPRTPRIKMGVHPPKRFEFSSPNQFTRDLESVSAGIQALSSMEDNFSAVIDKQTPNLCGSGIRTTPGGRSTPGARRKKPVFV